MCTHQSVVCLIPTSHEIVSRACRVFLDLHIQCELLKQYSVPVALCLCTPPPVTYSIDLASASSFLLSNIVMSWSGMKSIYHCVKYSTLIIVITNYRFIHVKNGLKKQL